LFTPGRRIDDIDFIEQFDARRPAIARLHPPLGRGRPRTSRLLGLSAVRQTDADRLAGRFGKAFSIRASCSGCRSNLEKSYTGLNG
jgi:hypothetical protein